MHRKAEQRCRITSRKRLVARSKELPARILEHLPIRLGKIDDEMRMILHAETRLMTSRPETSESLRLRHPRTAWDHFGAIYRLVSYATRLCVRNKVGNRPIRGRGFDNSNHVLSIMRWFDASPSFEFLP